MTDEHDHLSAVRQAVIDGDEGAAVETLRTALAAGVTPLDVLNDGLMAGATVVGDRFESGEYFLPELMFTGRALKAAMAELEPALKAAYAEQPGLSRTTGTVVIATVHHDIHDIGKNMVSSMLTASGFTVHDLGVDVPIKTVIGKAREVEADIIACSALLTTSMPIMRDLMHLLEASGERSSYSVMVGGAPVTEQFAAEIGADGSAPNAVAAVELARTLIRQRQEATQ
jgi:corrinoid protein of di/trimethylamine methyltransferase